MESPRGWGAIEDVAIEAVAEAASLDVHDALLEQVSAFALAGGDGLDVSDVRDPNRALAIALLRAGSYVEPTPTGRLRLTAPALERVQTAALEGA